MLLESAVEDLQTRVPLSGDALRPGQHLVDSRQVDLLVDLQVPDNLLSIRVVYAALPAQHHLQSLGANLVVQALPLSLIPDFALGAQLDGLCQDLIDLVLLYRSHIHGAVEGLCTRPVLSLAEVSGQGLV